MGEIKRAQEQRIDDVAVQQNKRKSRADSAAHFTIAANARTDEFYNDLGDFQDVESNYSGLSHVSSQPVMIPSSRSLISRDKRLPLNTWNQSGLQENVFESQFFYV